MAKLRDMTKRELIAEVKRLRGIVATKNTVIIDDIHKILSFKRDDLTPPPMAIHQGEDYPHKFSSGTSAIDESENDA